MVISESLKGYICETSVMMKCNLDGVRKQSTSAVKNRAQAEKLLSHVRRELGTS